MKKTLLITVTGLLSAILLTGCCLSHDWQDATCTEPKTCAKCGETEGEALGHTWVDATCATPKTCSVCGQAEGETLAHTWTDATCTTPKTCSVCGQTEGQAMGHTLTEANYQQPAVCTVCKETVGEPLEPDFVKYGLDAKFVTLDTVYDYKTKCYLAPEYTTTGKAIFTNYRTFDSADGFPAEDGYVWKSVDVTIEFGDDNANNYGISTSPCFEDYYNVVGHDESSNWVDSICYFTANYNGEDYPDCQIIRSASWTDWTTSSYSEWNYSSKYLLTINVRVPAGYDGYVQGLRNGEIEWGEGQYIYDLDNTDTLFFRFE